MQNLTYFNHTLHSFKLSALKVLRYHHLVFTIVYLAVNLAITEVSVSLIAYFCIFGVYLIFNGICQFITFKRTLQVTYSRFKLFLEIAVYGLAYYLVAVRSAFLGNLSDNHFGVFGKIAVYYKAILILSRMHPIGYQIRSFLEIQNFITLFEEDYITRYACVCVLECRIWQSDRTHKFRTLCKILTHTLIRLIHRTHRGHKSNNTATMYLIKCFFEEIVVYKVV